MTSVVDPSGRIQLPPEVRAALGLTEGGQVHFHVGSEAVILTREDGPDVLAKWRGAGTLPFGKDVEEYLAILRGKA